MIGQIWNAIAFLLSLCIFLLVIGGLVVIVGVGICLICEMFKDLFRR